MILLATIFIVIKIGSNIYIYIYIYIIKLTIIIFHRFNITFIRQYTLIEY